MSDNQRRIVSRLAFLFLCLLPTGFVVYQLLHQPTVFDWQAALQAKLGWNVQIDHMETPVPGTVIFHGVQIKDASGAVPAELNKVTLVTGKRHQLIIDHAVNLSPESLAYLVRLSGDQFSQIGFDSRPWQIIFNGGLTVVDEANVADVGVRLKPAQIDVQRVDGVVNATMQMRIPSQESDNHSPANIMTCSFEQNLFDKRKIIEVKTGPAGYLPSQFARPWLKEVHHFGDESYFSGSVTIAVDAHENVDARIVGVVGLINLENLVQPYGHVLRGRGEIVDFDCKIVDSRIKHIAGNLRSTYQGQVGRELLWAAQQHLGIPSYDKTNSDIVTFGDFSFDWQISDGELTVARDLAVAPREQNNVIARDVQGNNLLVSPNGHAVPIHQFASFLVPATTAPGVHEETVSLLSRFHFPKARMADLDTETLQR